MSPRTPRLLTERPLQLVGSAWARRILGWWGWSVRFEGLPAAQGVMVVYPHTSNLDFPLGLLAKWTMGLPARFWGKHTLFRIPGFGAWLRYLGGIAVDRSAPGGIVAQAVEALQADRRAQRPAWLALAPEGTRRRTEGWRSGFYRVALQAQVPVGVAAIDYGRKEIRVMHFLELSGDEAADLAAIADCLGAPRGFRPEDAGPIRLI